MITVPVRCCETASANPAGFDTIRMTSVWWPGNRQVSGMELEGLRNAADAKVLADVSAGLGQPMVGISASTLPDEERLEVRGW